jgi:hypothetical protein
MEQQQKIPDTPQEETIFTDQDWSMQGYDKHIKNARIMLFIVAGLQLLPLFTLPDNIADEAKYIIIGLQLFFAAVFVGLGLWTKYKPFAALLTAMLFFIGIWVLGAILDPASIFQGIIVKIIVIVLLILGIRNAKEAEELRKTYGK